MKVAILGSKHTYLQPNDVGRVMDESAFAIDEIHTTEDDGINALVRGIAEKTNTKITIWEPDWWNLDVEKVDVRKHPDNGKLYNKRAPDNRNKAMIDDVDAIIFIWDGESGGVKSMIKYAQEKNKLTYEVKFQPKE